MYIVSMPSRSEKPQRGNPHELVRRQHVFPAKSIERFARDGGVDLLDLKRSKVRRAGTTDIMFCADRAWNHGAETGWMKKIEDAFQSLVEDRLVVGGYAFTEAENEVVAEFFGLWRARARFRHLPKQTVKHEGILGVRHEFTADELEKLEKNNISAFRADGSLAMRDVTAPLIRLDVDRTRDWCVGRQWGVFTAKSGEFCVPDVPSDGIIPLTPAVVLALDNDSDAISESEVGGINRALQSSAQDYLFARSLAACPGLSLQGSGMGRGSAGPGLP